VRSTFAHLAGAPAGSRLDFTYVRADFISGDDLYGAPSLYRRFRLRRNVWKFGLAPEDVDDFLEGYGWRLIEQLGPNDLRERYVRPTGRDLPASEIEWSAYAEKR
jgi:O-methyltransferase involved in polyketide biosynthesis